MKDDWIQFCIDMMAKKADEYSGARKIISNVTRTFTEINDDLQLSDCGYTKSKMSMLRRLYLVPESRDAVVPLWERRLGQRKYGSVCFTCHGHTTKSDPNKGSKRASVMTPCIQSMSLTYHGDHTTEAHAFYRTTELFKKFPADLVFIRDELLPPFRFNSAPLTSLTFFFANVTVHPMYFAVLAPNLEDAVAALERVKKKDPHFWTWCVKWTARYLIPEYHRGIEKYAQGMRVHDEFQKAIGKRAKRLLTQYVGDNHPGMSKDYDDPEGDDE
jgi:hypothetical protein